MIDVLLISLVINKWTHLSSILAFFNHPELFLSIIERRINNFFLNRSDNNEDA